MQLAALSPPYNEAFYLIFRYQRELNSPGSILLMAQLASYKEDLEQKGPSHNFAGRRIEVTTEHT